MLYPGEDGSPKSFPNSALPPSWISPGNSFAFVTQNDVTSESVLASITNSEPVPKKLVASASVYHVSVPGPEADNTTSWFEVTVISEAVGRDGSGIETTSMSSEVSSLQTPAIVTEYVPVSLISTD